MRRDLFVEGPTALVPRPANVGVVQLAPIGEFSFDAAHVAKSDQFVGGVDARVALKHLQFHCMMHLAAFTHTKPAGVAVADLVEFLESSFGQAPSCRRRRPRAPCGPWVGADLLDDAALYRLVDIGINPARSARARCLARDTPRIAKARLALPARPLRLSHEPRLATSRATVRSTILAPFATSPNKGTIAAAEMLAAVQSPSIR
jgi:hypothetical protein